MKIGSYKSLENDHISYPHAVDGARRREGGGVGRGVGEEHAGAACAYLFHTWLEANAITDVLATDGAAAGTDGTCVVFMCGKIEKISLRMTWIIKDPDNLVRGPAAWGVNPCLKSANNFYSISQATPLRFLLRGGNHSSLPCTQTILN
ncbi:hypothetical protein AMTR_s00268p00013270 [Amborella trichopoda]|uniref:Uncharacterized protein n=1 Tax=Amborella trichopoda TaxID=13333 RepID=W1PAC5_AMBTC|nr:hypothetical protein AMTR_s00268p00013270 [Amborella trichopoda]